MNYGDMSWVEDFVFEFFIFAFVLISILSILLLVGLMLLMSSDKFRNKVSSKDIKKKDSKKGKKNLIIKYCKRCGKELETDEKYCKYCGKKRKI